MATKFDSTKALFDAINKLRASMSYIRAYGAPKTPPIGEQLDAFDKGLATHIDMASDIAERLDKLLFDAQLDAEIKTAEVMREARRQDPPQTNAQLWLLWDWLNCELETRQGSSVVEMVERTMLQRVLVRVITELQKSKE